MGFSTSHQSCLFFFFHYYRQRPTYPASLYILKFEYIDTQIMLRWVFVILKRIWNRRIRGYREKRSLGVHDLQNVVLWVWGYRGREYKLGYFNTQGISNLRGLFQYFWPINFQPPPGTSRIRVFLLKYCHIQRQNRSIPNICPPLEQSSCLEYIYIHQG